MAGTPDKDGIYRAAVRAHQAGRRDDAADGYRRALALDAGHLPSLNNLAAIMAGHGDIAAAEALYRTGLAHHPSSPELHANAANLLRDQGRLVEAAGHYATGLDLAPALTEVRYALAVVLRRLRRPSEAKAHLEQVTEITPDDPRGWTALAAVALDLGELGNAEHAIDRAVALTPDDPDTANVRGLVAKAAGDFAHAREAFHGALAVDPEHAEARYNLGALNLLLGNMPDAWADYEWRWRGEHELRQAPKDVPLWQGEDLNGKTILLAAEQGYGDTIQFIRYAPRLERQGARVLVRCRSALNRLIATAPGVGGIDGGADATPLDFWLPLMSLAHRFQTTEADIPFPEGYLDAPQTGEPAGKVLRVGLVWAGSASHENDANRSMTPDDLAPLLGLSGVAFVSLQTGPRGGDLTANGLAGRITDATQGITDFADTAARIAGLDLVITVDTAVAHLAGAIGRPAWVMLPVIPDWRWMLDRGDTPWYRTLRLFRQEAAGDWRAPVDRARAALAALASG